MSPLNIPPQPTLPPQVAPNDVELAWIEEQPEEFPTNQDSNYGLLRRILCDQFKLLIDEQEDIYNNHFLNTADTHLDMWEEMYGIPIMSAVSLNERRANVFARMKRGAFTRTARRELVEAFIIPTFGDTTGFGVDGIELSAGGTTLFGEPVDDLTQLYIILENVENFSYNVGVSRTLGADVASLLRELQHFTPAGITVQVTEDYFKTMGAISVASGGMVIDRSGL